MNIDRENELRTCANTVAVSAETPGVDLDNLQEVCSGIHGEFLHSFTGIPVKIDYGLEGNSYYLAVSQELFQELVKNNIDYKTP